MPTAVRARRGTGLTRAGVHVSRMIPAQGRRWTSLGHQRQRLYPLIVLDQRACPELPCLAFLLLGDGKYTAVWLVGLVYLGVAHDDRSCGQGVEERKSGYEHRCGFSAIECVVSL